ncbi:class I SAM-dependent methyltransferase [Flavobacterium kingsejongi]|uniref:SAM-dependent methyltransferase n=1 Tax=Flavobacterium kingsejongi TaxID=1678728 RepID=A0A2S1LR52_9FLAO|nr:class I SAM-dependent methyltransferase [Flavobacterium kingsejongi]AWG26237.1 SAM-dependent methyltransferase [Flavobacterium kingsejongi]
MTNEEDYITINRESWNKRTPLHLTSDFYNVQGFLQGNSSLNSIELELLGDVRDKKILHLQCHFGQDSLSLARMGALVTGVDLSDVAIESAKRLSKESGIHAEFICCDLYDLPKYLDAQFDLVFTSYGTIGWLPDLQKWAQVISKFLKPGGNFVFAEFHPVVWMFDDAFENVAYQYFKSSAIIETTTGTYAEKEAAVTLESVNWNHALSEVFDNLVKEGISIDTFREYDYSPYNCFQNTIESEPGKYRIEHLGNKIPMVYALRGIKK